MAGRSATSPRGLRPLGRRLGRLGYVRRADDAAIDAAWLEGGKFEVDLAGTRLRARVSLRCPFDPRGARIKG